MTGELISKQCFFLIYEVVFLTGSVVKYLPANSGDVRLILQLVKPLEEEIATHSSIIARKKCHRQSILEGYSHWGHKKWTQLSEHTQQPEMIVGGGSRGRGYIYIYMICSVIGQKPTQHCKAIILQLKIKKENQS